MKTICGRPSFCSSTLELGPHDHPAAAGEVGLLDAHPTADRAAGGEVGPRDDVHDLVEVDRRVVDIGDQGVADLAEIVRRDRGRHADGDAARNR